MHTCFSLDCMHVTVHACIASFSGPYHFVTQLYYSCQFVHSQKFCYSSARIQLMHGYMLISYCNNINNSVSNYCHCKQTKSQTIVLVILLFMTYDVSGPVLSFFVHPWYLQASSFHCLYSNRYQRVSRFSMQACIYMQRPPVRIYTSSLLPTYTSTYATSSQPTTS